jgi:hypothetical protein
MPKASNTASGRKAGAKKPQIDESDKENNGKKTPKAPKRVVWKSADDGVLVGVLTEQASTGHQSDNGWKSLVWTAASLALEGSELKSGGAPKNDEACLSRWGKVCTRTGVGSESAIYTMFIYSSRKCTSTSRYSVNFLGGAGIV